MEIVNYNKLVVCGIATTINRKEGLKQVVESMINQVNKLIVYQNGYKEIFDFLNSPKIEVISSLDTHIDMGDAGKYYKLSDYKNCYYFSIDDDIIYPPDYVSNTISNLEKYNGDVIITYHGRILKPDAKSYYLDYLNVFEFSKTQDEDQFVHFGGTGVMSFDTSKVNINFSYFETKNMADIWIGKFAQNNNIPILCLQHSRFWFKQIDLAEGSIYRTYKKIDFGQNKLIENFNTSKVINTTDIKPKTLLVVNKDVENKINRSISVIIPAYKCKDHIDECLNSVVKSSVGYDVEILVGIDGCEETLNHIKTKTYYDKIKFYYFTENKGPYTIKNTLAKMAKKDNILFFDSDDIMNQITIGFVVKHLNDFVCVKLKYEEFGDRVNVKKFGEGVFSIKKNLFISMNGFEPWMMAADTDFMNRLYKNNTRMLHSDKILFRRRVHPGSLTNRKDTGMSSPLRAQYARIIRQKTGDLNPKFLNVREYIEINPLNTLSEKLSIIIPTYKNTNYIDECINSVIESTKNNNIEILVGIDGCIETLEHIKTKPYPDNIKFYHFEKNVGPYIVKNSLSEIATGKNLLFFDSDDIMLPEMVNNSINLISHCDFIRHSYINFTDANSLNINKRKEFEGGILTIKKEIFNNMNGFEPWRCEADSEFALRLMKNNFKINVSSSIDFYRRIHNQGLTSKPETGYNSKLRSDYKKQYQNKKNFGPLPKKVTEPFIEITTKTPADTSLNSEPIKQKNHTILSRLMETANIEVTPVQKEIVINYNKVNETINRRENQKKIIRQEQKPPNKNSNSVVAQNLKVLRNTNKSVLTVKKPGGGSYKA